METPVSEGVTVGGIISTKKLHFVVLAVETQYFPEVGKNRCVCACVWWCLDRYDLAAHSSHGLWRPTTSRRSFGCIIGPILWN